MRPMRSFTLLTIVAAGCGSDFDPLARITSPRILAAKADAPFAPPGATVTVSPLAVDQAGAPVGLAFATCTRPQSTTAVGCALAADARFTPVAAAQPLSVTVPSTILDGVPLEGRRFVSFGLLLVACPGPLVAQPGPEGLPFSCLDATGARLPLGAYDLGVKRILPRLTDRNANPIIDRVTFDGQPWEAGEVKTIGACASATENRYDRCHGESHALSVEPTVDSFEAGVDEFSTPFTEQLLVSYYATDGLFDGTVRDAAAPVSRFKARAGARGRRVTLWFAIRDDRGGVAFTERVLEVQ
jgi:hypothetical protein